MPSFGQTDGNYILEITTWLGLGRDGGTLQKKLCSDEVRDVHKYTAMSSPWQVVALGEKQATW